MDGHGVSPTFCCGWTRCFTHRRHGVSPTGPPRRASNGAGLRNRNARARFLTYKIFNAPRRPSPVENSTGSGARKAAPPLGASPRRLDAFGVPPTRHPQGLRPSAFGLTPKSCPPEGGDLAPPGRYATVFALECPRRRLLAFEKASLQGGGLPPSAQRSSDSGTRTAAGLTPRKRAGRLPGRSGELSTCKHSNPCACTRADRSGSTA